MAETILEAIRQLSAVALAALTVYHCWTQRMRLKPVLVTAACGFAAWWALTPGVLGRFIS